MLTPKLVELFYVLFEGIMVFQVIFFGMVYLLSARKDALYYALLNFISATYFFLNAPETFLGIDEDLVFNSPVYLYVNFALFLAMILMYLIFLKEIFQDTINKYNYVKIVYTITFYTIPLLYVLFVWFAWSGWNSNIIFYTGHLINGPFCTLLLLLNFRVGGYKKLIIYGMLLIFCCITITVVLTVRYNTGTYHTILDKYPLFIIKVGMLIDILLFQLALLKKWNDQEKELAVEKLQSQLTVEKLRNKIAAGLHDDIGSTLSGIAMYSHMAQDQLSNGAYSGARQSLNVIKKSAGEVVEKLGDMVWIVAPHGDTMDDLLEKIELFGRELCAAKNIFFEMVTAEIPLAAAPGIEVYQHLYLFAKEAINNAVKYSGATVVQFRAALENTELKISIADNGSGFNRQLIKQGNGLANMEMRATAMGAVYSISSQPAKGTVVLLALKIIQ